MKKLFLLISILINTVSLYAMDLESEKIQVGVKWKMYTSDKTLAATVTSTNGETLKIFTSNVFDTIDKSSLPPEFVHVLEVIRDVHSKQNLDDVVMLGDLYVPLEQRGKGYAQLLCDKVCKELFNTTIKRIVLIPDPFEYIDGKQVLIQDSSAYETKKQALIKLYKKCGFLEDQVNDITYLHYENSKT